ncbi:hypothetical protein F4778DRAFT_347866 [Xylariomycetidae sp. FL2044]|nr:hypothetical protein F4778DRAFT_347866 [Xylariomycetidae sp. FL2044]
MCDEAAAKADYLRQLAELAKTQDLSEDKRSSVRSLSIAFTVFGAVFVGLRFGARYKQRVKYAADDWLMVLSLVLLFGNMAMNLALVNMGVGLHNGALELPVLEKIDETMVGAEVLYVTGVTMYKISLLFLYFRIFPVRSVRLGGYICGGISIAWNVGCIFAATFQCIPRNRLWQPWVQGSCINLFLTQLLISIPTILCDVAILCLPIPHVWRLQTNLTQRIFLMGIFLLGSYVVFTSIYRFRIFLLYRHDDRPFTIADGLSWNVIEISSGIVSACLPTLGPLVRVVFKSLHPSTRSRSRSRTLGLRGDYAPKSRELATIGGTGAPHPRSNQWSELHGSRDDYHMGGSENDLDWDPKKNSNMTVTVTHGGQGTADDDSNNDEIPLTAIRQHRVVEWKEERVNI